VIVAGPGIGEKNDFERRLCHTIHALRNAMSPAS
jgi:hypothetical protein